MSLLRNLRCQKLVQRILRAPCRTLENNNCKFLCNNVAAAATSTTIKADIANADAAAAVVLPEEAPPTFGQPTPETHPHLLKAGELVTGMQLDEFKKRRLRLIATLQIFAQSSPQSAANKTTCKNHFLIVPAATKKYLSGKIPYKFRQNSNFFYLTGCLEPDSLLVVSANERTDIHTMLFVRQKNERLEQWEGARTGPEQAVNMFGVDEAFELSEFERVFATRIKDLKPVIWYDGNHSDQLSVTQRINKMAEEASASVRTPSYYIQGMRLKKTLTEQALMRESCRIAAESLNEVMAETYVGQTEHQVAALLDYKCCMRNASHLAFPPVVAAGANATTLHYTSNTQTMHEGQLVLTDMGCEYGGYSSDLSRTWPMDSVFTKSQRLLYEVLLTVQKELIAQLLQAGGDTLTALQDSMNLKLGKYLQDLGIVPRVITEDYQLMQAGQQYCPHPVAHYLGLDVHDTEYMSRNLRLGPGMVFTVEPGIYIGAERTDVPKEFRGIGMRLEDDVLINQQGVPEVLTNACVKEVNEIEKLREKSKVARVTN